MQATAEHHPRGFSLVELSIVLVILGLLVGGVLAGQSLIHAAELRKVTEDTRRYFTAYYSFRDKYFALPGDITNATAFWGTAPTCPIPAGLTTPPTGTCNGNGNGQINGFGPESILAWNHLGLSGLIGGSYTGFPTSFRQQQGLSTLQHPIDEY